MKSEVEAVAYSKTERKTLCNPETYTVKKLLEIFPSSAGISLTKLSLAWNN
jgi:hypothetical protein